MGTHDADENLVATISPQPHFDLLQPGEQRRLQLIDLSHGDATSVRPSG
jgi:hypothetical protein